MAGATPAGAIEIRAALPHAFLLRRLLFSVFGGLRLRAAVPGIAMTELAARHSVYDQPHQSQRQPQPYTQRIDGAAFIDSALIHHQKVKAAKQARDQHQHEQNDQDLQHGGALEARQR